MPEEMLNFLATYLLRKHPDGYVVTNRRDPVKPKTFQRHLTALCEECHLAPVTFQQLRHTFAKRCLETGCDFVTLSHLLGHARIAQTLNQYGIFVHPAPKQALQAVFGILADQG